MIADKIARVKESAAFFTEAELLGVEPVTGALDQSLRQLRAEIQELALSEGVDDAHARRVEAWLQRVAIEACVS